jgi:hypothetical protein
MEVNKDKLIEILTKIDNRLSTIEKLLSTKEDSNTIDNNSNNLVPKKDIDFNKLLVSVTDTKQREIVDSIFNNKYPTITKSQYKMILDIASQNNVAIQ